MQQNSSYFCQQTAMNPLKSVQRVDCETSMAISRFSAQDL